MAIGQRQKMCPGTTELAEAMDNWAGEDDGRAARMSGLEDDGCITDDLPCFRAQPDLAGEWRKRDRNMDGRGSLVRSNKAKSGRTYWLVFSLCLI